MRAKLVELLFSLLESPNYVVCLLLSLERSGWPAVLCG